MADTVPGRYFVTPSSSDPNGVQGLYLQVLHVSSLADSTIRYRTTSVWAPRLLHDVSPAGVCRMGGGTSICYANHCRFIPLERPQFDQEDRSPELGVRSFL